MGVGVITRLAEMTEDIKCELDILEQIRYETHLHTHTYARAHVCMCVFAHLVIQKFTQVYLFCSSEMWHSVCHFLFPRSNFDIRLVNALQIIQEASVLVGL